MLTSGHVIIHTILYHIRYIKIYKQRSIMWPHTRVRARVRVCVCHTSDSPSHCTWACIHSRRSEFSFSRTPSLTCEQSSSAFSKACRRWLWSGWLSGVFSRIWAGREKTCIVLLNDFTFKGNDYLHNDLILVFSVSHYVAWISDFDCIKEALHLNAFEVTL